jgi:hypothetical protein
MMRKLVRNQKPAGRPELKGNLMHRALAVVGVAAAILGAGVSTASALDCANVSRPAPAQPTQPVADFTQEGGPVIYVVQGNWWFISFDGTFGDGVWDFVPPGTASSVLGMTAAQAASLGLPSSATQGNYQSGQGFGLLDKAMAPCITMRQTSHGIQAESIRCSAS